MQNGTGYGTKQNKRLLRSSKMPNEEVNQFKKKSGHNPRLKKFSLKERKNKKQQINFALLNESEEHSLYEERYDHE